MEDLPFDIQSKILSHVPRESVLDCKLVSKTWKTLLSDRKLACGLLLYIHDDDFWSTHVELRFGYYDEIVSLALVKDGDKKPLYKKFKEIKVKLPLAYEKAYTLIGSSNGLVCLFLQDEAASIVHIFNPYTGESFNLPTIDNKNHPMGFGYSSSSSNYKVVRIQYPNGLINKGLVQIYTLGGDSCGWRSIGEINYSLVGEGVLCDGSLHWLDKKQWKIVAFDLADEEFWYLPTTPSFELTMDTQLTVLGGYLSIVSMDQGNKRTNIWSFKNKPNDDDFAVKDGYYPSWDWILEFSIPFFPKDDYIYHDRYEPIGLTKNGVVLLLYQTYGLWGNGDPIICRYDPKTDSLIKVLRGDKDFSELHGIPHVNSLVSLKALGVDSPTVGFATKALGVDSPTVGFATDPTNIEFAALCRMQITEEDEEEEEDHITGGDSTTNEFAVLCRMQISEEDEEEEDHITGGYY